LGSTVFPAVRLLLVREEGRKVGEGDEVREEGTDDEGRGIGTALLAAL